MSNPIFAGIKITDWNIKTANIISQTSLYLFFGWNIVMQSTSLMEFSSIFISIDNVRLFLLLCEDAWSFPVFKSFSALAALFATAIASRMDRFFPCPLMWLVTWNCLRFFQKSSGFSPCSIIVDPRRRPFWQFFDTSFNVLYLCVTPQKNYLNLY